MSVFDLDLDTGSEGDLDPGTKSDDDPGSERCFYPVIESGLRH